MWNSVKIMIRYHGNSAHPTPMVFDAKSGVRELVAAGNHLNEA